MEENKFAAAGNEEECGGARRRHMSFGFIRYSQSRNSRDPLIGELEERDHLSHFLSLSLSFFATVITSVPYNARQRYVTWSPLSLVNPRLSAFFF